MYQQQPLLASRVVEAAMRAALSADQAALGISFSDLQRQMLGMSAATANCSLLLSCPVADLFAKPKLAPRACSQLVSALKRAQLAMQQQLQQWQQQKRTTQDLVPRVECMQSVLAAAFDPSHMLYGMSAGSLNSALEWVPGRDTIKTKVLPQQEPCSTQEVLDAPACGALLGMLGRALLAFSQVLAALPDIKQLWAAPTGAITCSMLAAHTRVLPALIGRLTDLQAAQQDQASDTPHTARVILQTVLAQLLQQATELLEGRLCSAHAMLPLTAPLLLTNQASMAGLREMHELGFNTLLEHCTEGGLPQELHALGAAVWAAFPQKYACNDPACTNLEGLTEAACAKHCCTGCKVGALCVRGICPVTYGSGRLCCTLTAEQSTRQNSVMSAAQLLSQIRLLTQFAQLKVTAGLQCVKVVT